MNTAYFSAFAALAGSVIGGLTTFAAAWVTQRQQANVQWLLQEKTRRQELYQQFIEEASKVYVDALMHDQAAIPPLVSLYASVNKMRVVSRVVSTPEVTERADKLVRMIVEAYFSPNKTLPELRAMMKSGALDFLRDFSEACREELAAVTPAVFSYRSAPGSRVGLVK
jgi:dGTP triphosphohydrolase